MSKRENEKKFYAERVSNFGTSIWDEYTQLSNQYKTVNLGQGFASFEPPTFVKENLKDVSFDTSDLMRFQYSPSRGSTALLEAIVRMYNSRFGGKLNAKENVLVTNGASQAIYAAFLGLLNAGDEVIIFEPFYGIYRQSLTLVGAKPKYVSLERAHVDGIDNNNANSFQFKEEELRNAVTGKTKMILVNTPHNPTGKTFSKKELNVIAQVAKENDLLVMSDEVYDCQTYGKYGEHYRIATLDGMFERTLTCGSFGKIFSATGLKTGFLVGPANLVQACVYGHAYSNFCCITPIQKTIARSIDDALGNGYLDEVKELYESKKNLCGKILGAIFGEDKVLHPNGAYFFVCDISDMDFPYDPERDGLKDYAFTKYMIKEIGVTAIPLSCFYSPENQKKGENYIRFAFAKPEEMLKDAGKRMEKLCRK